MTVGATVITVMCLQAKEPLVATEAGIETWHGFAWRGRGPAVPLLSDSWPLEA